MDQKLYQYDVIVVGGGHAGTEAALAAARIGASTLLLSHSLEGLGQLSCNPAIGGIGKGHLVKEIDALDGLMAHAADKSGIQFRILNTKKGPAVRATRAQIDRQLYKATVQAALGQQAKLYLFQQGVEDLICSEDVVRGVVTQTGLRFFAPCVILATGTFLRGRIHIGMSNHAAGRAGEPPAIRLADRLRELPLRVGRLKTGTPPRIDARSIDYRVCTQQLGDDPVPVFSFLGNANEHPRQIACHITHTNEKTHDIIRGALDDSPMYNGDITSPGPRYCPSVEDKVVRFADKPAHQIFIEPEGLDSNEIYPNGISTSLPFAVQHALVRSIRGFESARITRPGYAIEYDFFDPRDLYPWLESKIISGLFFAGQINGTTGYEEAAAQGLLAGVNAALRAQDKATWYPGRDTAYLGVMVDDLVVHGTSEPYRMFTSRAEYRLLLREDNADLRLTEIARKLGLVSDERWSAFSQKRAALAQAKTTLAAHQVNPDADLATSLDLSLRQPETLLQLLQRPEVTAACLSNLPTLASFPSEIIAQLEIQAKYSGYIRRQSEEIDRLRQAEHTILPIDFDYHTVRGLSNEVVQKLSAHRPHTLGQAIRIPGVTPAALSLLLVHMKKSA